MTGADTGMHCEYASHDLRGLFRGNLDALGYYSEKRVWHSLGVFFYERSIGGYSVFSVFVHDGKARRLCLRESDISTSGEMYIYSREQRNDTKYLNTEI